MNQHLASVFSIVKNDKVFQFMCGAATFEEVMDVLEEFKVEFIALKSKHEEAAAKQKSENAESAPVSEPTETIEPEVLNS